MSKFIQHIIREGDTLQGIAQYRLGSMDSWTILAQFNDLRYPYIVDTIEEKMTNPDHLVTVGDVILVKVADDAQTNLIEQLKRTSEYDKEELYALALGKDLAILPGERTLLSPGDDGDIFGLKGDSRGKISTVRGVDNLKQSLYVRLTTPRGSYVGHPRYGSNLHKYLGMKNTEENATLIDLEIERTLRTDSRVTACEIVSRKITGNSYTVHFKVTSITLEEAFDFVLTSRAAGQIALLDNYNDTIF